MEKHRALVECAACHAKIDPPGFALEHFDAAGQWRDHYVTRKGKGDGPPVDSAYQLADGRSFNSFSEFRALAATDARQIARNFAAKVLVYATGREISFADRKALDQIVSETENENYPIRSLIESVVTSHPFPYQVASMTPRKHSRLKRRTVLRGSGVAMALPWLSAMRTAGAATEKNSPRRFVSVSLGLGLLPENLFPEKDGENYAPSRYLKPLADVRDQFTVVSGVSHPGVSNGHRAEASILTATPIGNSGSARNTISVDQLLAKHLGDETRYPSLVLSNSGTQSPSYTETGSMVPALGSPGELFAKLFVNESKREQLRQADRIRSGRSIMDVVNEDAKSLRPRNRRRRPRTLGLVLHKRT